MYAEDEVDVDANELDELYMREALAEARVAAEMGEVPIGAVVVCDGKIVARAHNLREHDEDPSAHAEFSAMVAAARALGRWRLTGCTVYVTLEPCTMCAGLMVNARIDRCVYGAADPKAGAVGSLYNLSSDARLNHTFEVRGGVLERECADTLRAFFAAARARELPREIPDDVLRAARRTPAPAPALAPRILLAIDSFKECASSADIESWVERGIRRVVPDACVASVPVADGGEGTLEAVHAAMGGRFVPCEVTGPLGEHVAARYLLTEDARAVIEMAEAAGIEYSPCTHDAALRATTRGVGELVLDAVAHGARTVYFAIGGSATNDGGAGFLQALGARVLDGAGHDVDPGLAGLRDVTSIDLDPAFEALRGCELVVLSDVDNPLVGKRGALRVFGPQKGLDLDADPACEVWMLAYGRALDEARTACEGADRQVTPGAKRFRSVLGVPGAGAAGGLGAALLALGAASVSGADTVLDLVGFDALLTQADMVVTGEGMIDGQTAGGKVPVRVAQRAKRAHKPVFALVGGREDDLDAVYRAGIDVVLPILRKPMALACALSCEEAERNLVCAGETLARIALTR